MKDHKRMVIWIGAMVVLLIAASTAVIFAGKRDDFEGDILVNEAGNRFGYQTGIHYGGDFDEFGNYHNNPDSPEAADPEISEDESADPEKTPKELLSEMDTENIKRRIMSEENNIPLGSIEEYAPDTLDSDVSGSDRNRTDNSGIEILHSGEIKDVSDITVSESKGYYNDEVVCDAASQEEAERIASQISGTLLSWDNGMAVIQIKSPVDEFLEQLEQEGSDLQLYRHYYF